MMNRKDAQAMFDPSPPLKLVYDADAEMKKTQDLTTRLNEVTTSIKMQRELLESTMTEDQRAVFRDYVAGLFLRDQLTMLLDAQMRQLVQRRRDYRG